MGKNAPTDAPASSLSLSSVVAGDRAGRGRPLKRPETAPGAAWIKTVAEMHNAIGRPHRRGFAGRRVDCVAR